MTGLVLVAVLRGDDAGMHVVKPDVTVCGLDVSGSGVTSAVITKAEAFTDRDILCGACLARPWPTGRETVDGEGNLVIEL